MIPFLSDEPRRGRGQHARRSASGSSRSAADRSSCCATAQPFWEVLEEHGIETTRAAHARQLPALRARATRELTGMGTPDLLGTYGTFSFYTSDPFTFAGKDVGGGKVYEVGVVERRRRGQLYGPDNPFLAERRRSSTADFTRLPRSRRAGGQARGRRRRSACCKVGEWSDWVPVDVRARCRRRRCTASAAST